MDACAANLMRPAMYGAYHHITVLGKENAPCDHKYDVVGALCENNDKFAIDRMLPKIDMGDLSGHPRHRRPRLLHGLSATTAGCARAELLLKEDGSIQTDPPRRNPRRLFCHSGLVNFQTKKTAYSSVLCAVFLRSAFYWSFYKNRSIFLYFVVSFDYNQGNLCVYPL